MVWHGFLTVSLTHIMRSIPLDKGEVHFNITSEVNCAPEEYVEEERTFAAIDDDDDNDGKFLPGAISSSGEPEEENDEEIENN